MAATGTDDWWRQIISPQIMVEQEQCQVIFWWRDPAGSEETSAIRRVWVYITGVTDHHQNARPQSMQRVPGTDVWRWQTTLSPRWRGSYCFIPSVHDDDFAAAVFSAQTPDRYLLREGWRKLLPQAIADPLNPQSWRGKGTLGFGAGDAAGGTAGLDRTGDSLSPCALHRLAQHAPGEPAAGMDLYHRRGGTGTTSAGHLTGWPVLGREYAGVASAGTADRRRSVTSGSLPVD